MSATDIVRPNTYVKVSTVAPRLDVHTPFIDTLSRETFDIEAEFGPDPYESRPAVLAKVLQTFDTEDDFINDNTDVMILKKILGAEYK